jgi:hypothetical protein
VAEFLLATKVALSRFNRCVSKQKLDLLKLASGSGITVRRCGASHGEQGSDTGTLRRRLHHVPDRLGCDSIAPDLTQVTYASEDDAIDAGRGQYGRSFVDKWDRSPFLDEWTIIF